LFLHSQPLPASPAPPPNVPHSRLLTQRRCCPVGAALPQHGPCWGGYSSLRSGACRCSPHHWGQDMTIRQCSPSSQWGIPSSYGVSWPGCLLFGGKQGLPRSTLVQGGPILLFFSAPFLTGAITMFSWPLAGSLHCPILHRPYNTKEYPSYATHCLPSSRQQAGFHLPQRTQTHPSSPSPSIF
jgi:hypothetical protein